MKKTVSFFYFLTLSVWTTALFSANSQQSRPTTPICYLNTPRPGTPCYLPKPAPYIRTPHTAAQRIAHQPFKVATRETLHANKALYRLKRATRPLEEEELFRRGAITRQYIAARDLTILELNNAIERADIQEEEAGESDFVKAMINSALIKKHHPGKIRGYFPERRGDLTQTPSILGGSKQQEPIKPTPKRPLRSNDDIVLQQTECIRDIHEVLEGLRERMRYFGRFRTELLTKTVDVQEHKNAYKKIYQEYRQLLYKINGLLKQAPNPILEKECANLDILAIQLRADCYLRTISTESECADLYKRFMKEQPNNIGDRNRCFIIQQLIPEIDNDVNQFPPEEQTPERIKAIIAEKINGTGIHLESALKATGYSNLDALNEYFKRTYFDDLIFPIKKDVCPPCKKKMASVLQRIHENACQNVEQLHSLFENTVEKLKEIGYDN